MLEPLIAAITDLGRLPHADEFEQADEIIGRFGTLKRAFTLVRRVTRILFLPSPEVCRGKSVSEAARGLAGRSAVPLHVPAETKQALRRDASSHTDVGCRVYRAMAPRVTGARSSKTTRLRDVCGSSRTVTVGQLPPCFRRITKSQPY